MVVIQSSVLFLSSVGDFNAAAHVSGAVGRGYAPDGFRSTGVGGVTPTCGVGSSEEHTSELQSLMRISYAVFCLKKKMSPVSSAHICRMAGQQPPTVYRAAR